MCQDTLRGLGLSCPPWPRPCGLPAALPAAGPVAGPERGLPQDATDVSVTLRVLASRPQHAWHSAHTCGLPFAGHKQSRMHDSEYSNHCSSLQQPDVLWCLGHLLSPPLQLKLLTRCPPAGRCCHHCLLTACSHQHSTAQHSTAQHSTAQHSTAPVVRSRHRLQGTHGMHSSSRGNPSASVTCQHASIHTPYGTFQHESIHAPWHLPRTRLHPSLCSLGQHMAEQRRPNCPL